MLYVVDTDRVVVDRRSDPAANMFPEALVRSVETVTGGASAAYGTNAVAGVVNFLLDTDYEGVKLKMQVGFLNKIYI